MNWSSIAVIRQKWIHIVLTYDYSTGVQSGYVDAQFKVSETLVDSINHSTLQIGRGGQDASNQLSTYTYTPAKFGPVKVYDRVLSLTEIRQNFNAVRERYNNV
jgi:hypothetical protein